MNKTSKLTLFAIPSLSLIISAAQAATTLISVGTGDNNVVGSIAPEATDRDEDFAIDGSGLSTNGSGKLVHQSQPLNASWNIKEQNGFLTIDLGAEYRIDIIQIWNYNFNNFTDFGPTSIDLKVSNTGTNASDATFGATTASLSIAAGTGLATYEGEHYRFNGIAASQIAELGGTDNDFSSTSLTGRFIRFDNMSGSDRFGGRLGLSEVRFYGELASIPEPSTYALLGGLSALLLVLKSRRQKR